LDGLLQLPFVLFARFRGYKILYIRENLFSFVTILLARMIGMTALSEHNSWSASEREGLGGGRLMIKFEHVSQVWTAKLSHKSRSVTQGITDLLILNGVAQERTVTIGNGCDINEFTPQKRSAACDAMGVSGDALRLGFIGGLVPWQGVETAILSLKHLPITNSEGRNIELVIVGEGVELTRLKKLAAQLGLSERVHFVGYIARERAADAIGSFDIAIAPFTNARNAEIGLSPIKIRDYAACGRPVVSSAIPGITELAEHGWLTCHLPDDEKDLAMALAPLIESETARQIAGEKARQFAETNFDWRVIADSVASSLIER
jgi:glycosyltransferase involved in cell wall biosynthesis